MKYAITSIYCALGWVFFAIGVIGAFLPVLPTTIFMIVALWMFAKGSPRFHQWLYHHPLFGETLQRWETYRVIPVKAKFFAISMMTVSEIYLVFYSSAPSWAVVTAGISMAAGAWYILSKPSHEPAYTVTSI